MILSPAYQRWFFDSAYCVSGRPKMEDDLMDYAKKSYLDCLVQGTFLPNIVENLQALQDIYYERNKRLKKVYIGMSKDDGSNMRWLYIGAQHLTLRKVRDEILSVTKV